MSTQVVVVYDTVVSLTAAHDHNNQAVFSAVVFVPLEIHVARALTSVLD